MDQREYLEKQKKRQIFIADIITFVISFLIGVAIFLIYFLVKGIHLLHALNAVTIAGVVLFCVSILVLLNRFGAFDTFVYGFKQMGSTMFTKNPTKYNNMADYKIAKAEERKTKGKYYIPIMIAAAIFLVATLILEIIYRAS